MEHTQTNQVSGGLHTRGLSRLIIYQPVQPDTTSGNRALLGVFAHHVGDVLLHAFILMKRPLSVVLAFFMTSALVSWLFHASQESALSARLCEYPIVSLLPPCTAAGSTPALDHSSPTIRADFAGLAEIQHRALDQLTARAGIGADIALNIKHSELAVRDLIIMIQSSNLTTKDVLAATMMDFVSEARRTSRALQGLSTKIHGTMDRSVCARKHR